MVQSGFTELAKLIFSHLVIKQCLQRDFVCTAAVSLLGATPAVLSLASYSFSFLLFPSQSSFNHLIAMNLVAEGM